MIKRLPVIVSFLFVLLIANGSFGQAPSIQWSKCFGGSDGDGGESIIKTSDGGYAIIGSTGSNDGQVSGNHGLADIWFIKLDSAGNLQFQKCFGGPDSEEGRCLIQTMDHGYILAGTTNSISGDVTGGGYHGGFPTVDFWVVKVDSIGNLQWQKCYGGSNNDYPLSIVQTYDSGFAICGYVFSDDGDVTGIHSLDTSDIWVIKIDNTGNLIWQGCYGGTDIDEAHSIIQASDSSLLIAGFTLSNDGDVIGNHGLGSSDCWILKLNQSGNLLSQKCLGGTGYDFAYSIIQTVDMGFMIAGFSGSNDGDVSGNHGSSDYWIVKLNFQMVLQWEYSYGGTMYEWVNSILQCNDSTFLILGTTDSNDGDVSGYHGNGDIWVINIDYFGNLQWEYCLGGTANEFLYTSPMIQNNDRSIIIASTSYSNDGDVSGNHGLADVWVVKLYPSNVGLGSPSNLNSDFSVYYNCSSEEVAISFTDNLNESIRIHLMDVTGRILQMQAIYSIPGLNKITIPVNSFTPGIYLVRLETNTSNVTRRVVVE